MEGDSPLLTAFGPQWRCAKHGLVFNITFSYDNTTLGNYCFKCYHEWIAANVTKVTKDEGAEG